MTTQHAAPPMAAPTPPPRRGLGRWLTVTIVMLILAAAGVTVAAIAFGVRTAASLRQETTTETVPGVHAVVVEADEGSVRLRHSGGTGVEVRTTRVWSPDSRPSLERHLDGGVLTLGSSCPLVDLGCEVDREIAVPAGTSVRVRTVDGPIDAEGLVSPRFEASTVDGQVTVSFGQPPEHVEVRSVDGSVRLTLPSARYRVEASAVDGEARVGVRSDPSAVREVSVSTVDGGIDVLPG